MTVKPYGRQARRHGVKPLLVAAMTLALLGSALESSFGVAGATRTERCTYVASKTGPAAMIAKRAGAGLCTASPGPGCVSFKTRPRDRFVRLSVQDATKTGPVLAYVAQDLGDGPYGVARFCGRSGRIRIPYPGKDLDVFLYDVYAGAMIIWYVPVPYVDRCTNGGFATTGTVKATFSR